MARRAAPAAVTPARRTNIAAAAGLVLCAALAVLTVCASRVARADPPPRARLAVVRMMGAEACPDGEALAREVSRRLARNPFDPSATRLLEVVLLRQAGAWVGRIFVRDAPDAPPGVREITSEAATCDQLASGVALAVALAVDPEAPISAALPRGTGRGTTSGNAGNGAAESGSGGTAAPTGNGPDAGGTPGGGQVASGSGAGRSGGAPPVRHPAPAPNAWDAAARITLRGGVALGLVPDVGLAVAVGFDPPRTGPGHFTFGVTLLPESRTADQTFAGGVMASFSFGLTAGWLGYCLGTANARLAVDACALFAGGLVHAVPHNLDPERPGDYPWIAFGLEGRASLRLIDQLVLELQVTPLLPVIHQRYQVLDRARNPLEPPVFEPWYAALVATLGLRLRFW